VAWETQDGNHGDREEDVEGVMVEGNFFCGVVGGMARIEGQDVHDGDEDSL
jgi:hypothetical protein